MTELPHLFTTSFFISLVILGLVVGSFLNVVIHRLPIMLEKQWQQESNNPFSAEQKKITQQPYNLALPASHCPTCRHQIRLRENIPVLSYVLLKGRCSACKTQIPIRYPVIECTTAAITLLVGWQFGISIETVAYCFLSWFLLALAVIDYDTQLLPDVMTLPLVWGGLLFNSIATNVSLYDAVWGGAAGYLALWSVFWAYKLVTGKDGMGYGDFKLLAALGAWLGWIMLPIIIFLSSLVGVLISLSLVALKRHAQNQPIPFGPYLSGAGFIALLWGDQLRQFYFQFMGI
ncbi:MAG: A24 family peptidase [Endozoicomonas sp. (ex Botrylloides leachii)]|nr:A24 family peptidase [Endozoicomonas sp. (ex Botrylloides leachii)]